jgi:hypothetical protein
MSRKRQGRKAEQLRRWPLALAGLGGAGLLAMGANIATLGAETGAPYPAAGRDALARAEVSPQEMAAWKALTAPPALVPRASERSPAPVAPASAAEPAKRAASVRRTGGGSGGGHIGPTGPLPGKLNTKLAAGGPILGPIWDRSPLPVVLPGPTTGRPSRASAMPAVLDSPLASELPSARTIALSRLANPAPQTRTVPQVKPAEATADRPLSLRLSLSRSGYRVGDTVAARMVASGDCYAALIRVDANGSASTVFRSSSPSRRFACVFTAGPVSGAEYLVSIASVRPLDGADVAAALRASGAGFAAVPAAAPGSTAPAQAWSLALGQASGLGGAAAHWQRFEWDVAALSFNTTAPPPAIAKGSGSKSGKVAARPDTVKPTAIAPPAPVEGSVLPKGDVPKADAPKPEPAKPEPPASEPKPATDPKTEDGAATDKATGG